MDIDTLLQSILVYSLETRFSKATIRAHYSCVNGCGAKGGIDVPDSILFVSIEAACNLHDLGWELAVCADDVIEANYSFRRNMERIIDAHSSNIVTKLLRYKIMNYYYTTVKLAGTTSYLDERGLK